jgi:hypothetical protein
VRRRVLSVTLRVVVFAVVGAVLTVLVAWGIALWGPSTGSHVRHAAPNWYPGLPTEWPRSVPLVSDRFDNIGHSMIGCATLDYVDGRGYSQTVHLQGFPLHAMKAESRRVFIGKTQSERTFVGTWRFPGRWTTRPYLEASLGLFPLWRGFLIDTVFWGTTAFIVWSVPGLARRGVRRRRGRRGRCVGCGYELKGLAVCPECGGGA